MTLEDLLRHRLVDEGHRQVVLSATSTDWQASLLRPTGTAYRVESAADPADALWNVLCELPDRRNPPAPADDDEDLIG